MALDPILLEVLACPVCKTPVKLTPNKGGLKCARCGRVYPIKDDIPIMLVDEATIEKSPRPKAKTTAKAKPKAKPRA